MLSHGAFAAWAPTNGVASPGDQALPPESVELPLDEAAVVGFDGGEFPSPVNGIPYFLHASLDFLVKVTRYLDGFSEALDCLPWNMVGVNEAID
jgi:hypothetical protein